MTSTDRLWRALIRIERLAADGFKVVVPGWRHDKIVTVPVPKMLELLQANGEFNLRIHGRVNLGAEDGDVLRFEPLEDDFVEPELWIDSTTLLFRDISLKLRHEMKEFCEDIVIKGRIPNPLPDWVEKWFTVGKFDDRQRLLVISTVLPQRIMLSLLRADQEGRAE